MVVPKRIVSSCKSFVSKFLQLKISTRFTSAQTSVYPPLPIAVTKSYSYKNTLPLKLPDFPTLAAQIFHSRNLNELKLTKTERCLLFRSLVHASRMLTRLEFRTFTQLPVSGAPLLAIEPSKGSLTSRKLSSKPSWPARKLSTNLYDTPLLSVQ